MNTQFLLSVWRIKPPHPQSSLAPLRNPQQNSTHFSQGYYFIRDTAIIDTAQNPPIALLHWAQMPAQPITTQW